MKYEDVTVGEELAEVEYPLNVYRLVMAAGANRDFNSIHHNSEYARRTGAQEMYANTSFLLGAWERCVRDWMGEEGTMRAIRDFRMKAFNYAGETMWVRAHVAAKRLEGETGVVEVAIRCENGNGITVGPGVVEVVLPRRTEGLK
ncbi:acyl dehydratase [Thermocatellispora tengchongensis]|uniref:Acyl dehydratase n=1 Tax=Thermocatellispora tengchongensis TaxID=1073253 RepID=A0A840P1B2_9ACTN|nr:MaoC/PaaZ C-terminal domain-containing protein [Thermocatellispora tengchongensis]MBB5132256.1 acyl dehydratase [Thermocatellispora tengchongensis]